MKKKNLVPAIILISTFLILGAVIYFLISYHFPDVDKVITKNQLAVEKKFLQIKDVCQKALNPSLPDKKMEMLPEKIWILTVNFINADYDGQHNAAMMPLDFCKNFKWLEDDKLSLGYYSPLINLNDAFLKGIKDHYQRHPEEIRRDLKALKKITYLVVIKNLELNFPVFKSGDKTVQPGKYLGEVSVYELENGGYFGPLKISASNSESINVPGRHGSYKKITSGYKFKAGKYKYRSSSETVKVDRGSYDKRVMEAAWSDFRGNISREIEKSVPLHSYNPFIKK